ncbi:hypothetical protein [Xylanibacter rodentium]|uniref:hypothetical protein n=1 Tax=Xylanibacter rodentium TaxID=2736289 RepID=UPI00256F5C94|nr:hypothetical protein [Xylanibacter rodentium]
MADKPGWMFLADTLIRAYLHMNPEELADEEWAHQIAMAEWVKQDLTVSLWRTK